MKFTLVESFLNETLVTIQDELNPVLWSDNKFRPEIICVSGVLEESKISGVLLTRR